MIVPMALLLALVGSSPAVAPTPVEAACAAQRFLGANGYLEGPPTLSNRELSLELWDGIRCRRDGVIDYEQLIRDRRGTYAGRLEAVKRDGDGFMVAYRFDGGIRSCLFASLDLKEIWVVEAPCRLRSPLIRMREPSLRCERQHG